MTDILPDSRTRRLTDTVKMDGVEMRPVFCANCGRPEGYVPVGMTYAFFLCDKNGCADKYGNDAHFMREPDESFFARARELQAEEERRLAQTVVGPVIFTQEFLAKMLANPSSLFSKLKRDFDRHLRSFSDR